MKYKPADPEKVWGAFQDAVGATNEQLEKFKRYESYLGEQSELFNLTALRELVSVVRNHFQDSLTLGKFVDFSAISSICDIGTGAGFPAIPLKIMFPHLRVVLIEVTRKKREFLANVVSLLGLENVEICELDWRTFLRKTEYDIDLFVTRAALADLELSRMFKPACRYNKATLVYWASEQWEVHPKVVPLVSRQESYKLGPKMRRFIFFALPPVPQAA